MRPMSSLSRSRMHSRISTATHRTEHQFSLGASQDKNDERRHSAITALVSRRLTIYAANEQDLPPRTLLTKMNSIEPATDLLDEEIHLELEVFYYSSFYL